MTTQGELSGGGKRKVSARYYSEPRTHVRNPDDFYVENWWCVDMLLDAEDFERGTRVVADPCCGSGTIVRRCRARGIEAYGSDLRDRGAGFPIYDFMGDGDQLFAGDWAALFPKRPTDIIMNPPFKANAPRRFIERARQVVPGKVAAIVQSKYLYGANRWAWFDHQCPPSRIYHCSTRPSMPPGEKLLAGGLVAEGGKLDYCILVYDPMHIGAATTHWLRSRYSLKQRRREPGHGL